VANEHSTPRADAATRAIVVPEPISRGMEAAHRGIDGTKVPANKAFSKTCGIRAGQPKDRRSFTPILATKDAYLQDVLSGSDGTRTRDLRRDRPAF
jgi:hypothetical protein